MDNLEKRVSELEKRANNSEQDIKIMQVKYDNLDETVKDIKKDTESLSTISLAINNIGLKLDNYSELTKKQDKSIELHSDKIQTLENRENKNIANIARRITWSVVGICITAIVTFLITQL